LPPAAALSSCNAAAKPPLLAGCAVPTRRVAAGLICVGSIFIYARRIFRRFRRPKLRANNGALIANKALTHRRSHCPHRKFLPHGNVPALIFKKIIEIDQMVRLTAGMARELRISSQQMP
jgi:hypothetical protein